MSAQAVGWVFSHSPLSGDRLVVHLAIADIVNDAYENECWLAVSTLAEKARVSRSTVQRTCADLVARGLLEEVEAGGGRGKPTRYRFLMPEKGSLSDTLSETETVAPSDGIDGERVAPSRERVAPTHARVNRDEPKEPKLPADGVVGTADRLCRSWWESLDPRPLTPFIGARKIVERAVKAGYSEEQIASALFRLGRSISIPQLQRELERRSPPRPENPNPAASRSWMEN